MKYYNTKFTIRKYMNYEIHSVTNGIWKYDVYHHGLYFSSVNTLKDAKEFIKSTIWVHKNVPL